MRNHYASGAGARTIFGPSLALSTDEIPPSYDFPASPLKKLFVATALSLTLAPTAVAVVQALANGFTPDTSTLTANQMKTVLITDQTVPGVFASPELSFSNIIARISSPNVSDPANVPEQTRINFLQTLINTFSLTSATNPANNVVMPLTVQPGAIELKAANMLTSGNSDSMAVTAVIPRLDLADGVTCGEIRVESARQGGINQPSDRFFLIAEAALPNPNPEAGLAGCVPYFKLISNFQNETATTIASQLSGLLITGMTIPASGTSPAVTAGPALVPNNLGNKGVGQVRANMFMNGNPVSSSALFDWQLRQWDVVENSTNGVVSFVPAPVSQSPDPRNYRGPVSGQAPAVTNMQNAFVENMPAAVAAVMATDVAATKMQTNPTDRALIHDLAVAQPFPPQFWGFQSTSSFVSRLSPLDEFLPDIVPPSMQGVMSDAFAATAGQVRWPVPVFPDGAFRLQASGCSGCHSLAGNQPVGPSATKGSVVQFPTTAELFVMIDELGNPGTYLTNSQLPQRFKMMNELLTSNPPPVPSGWATIKSAYSDLCLTVPDSSTVAGTALDQETCTGGTNQQFQFKKLSNGGEEITARNSGLQLDIYGQSVANGAPVIQWPFWNGTNEMFSVSSSPDGRGVIMRAFNSGKAITVSPNAPLNSLDPVVQYDNTVSNPLTQEWVLTPVESVSGTAAALQDMVTPTSADQAAAQSRLASRFALGNLRSSQGIPSH